MLEEKEINQMLANELAQTAQKLEKAIKTLEWLHNFVSDKVVKDMTAKTLKEIK